MGASLNNNAQVKQQLDKVQADTQAAARELQLDLAQSALDAAGLVDPTPISDAAGALLSAARGDWFGAGMSLVSMIPYAGDAIGKTAKGARLVAKMAQLKERIADNLVRGKQIMMNALKSDATTLRAKKALDKAARIEDSLVNGCKVGGNRFGTHGPKEGWVSGDSGHGSWDPSTTGMNKDKLEDIESVTGGKPISFKDGYPDFSEYTPSYKAADGSMVPGRVEIQMDGTKKDFDTASKAMAEKLGLDEFVKPKDMTWHHHQDGVTMELIPTELHKNVPHAGGASLARDPGY